MAAKKKLINPDVRRRNYSVEVAAFAVLATICLWAATVEALGKRPQPLPIHIDRRSGAPPQGHYNYGQQQQYRRNHHRPPIQVILILEP